MKVTKEITGIVCDVCEQILDQDEDYIDYDVVHVHRTCLDSLPNWVQNDPESFVQAIRETQTMPEHAYKPTFKDFIEGTTERRYFYVFIFSEEEKESGWVCTCNSLKSVETIWRDLKKDQWIEGVFHDDKFRKMRVEVKITLEEKGGVR